MSIEDIRTEAIRSRGFIRGAETQLSKVIDLIDALEGAEPEEPPVEEPEEPTPEPPPSGDLTLLHEFSPAAGEPIPDGVNIKIADGSWVPGGKAERTADGYLMTYLVGMEDGRGPGRIGVEPAAIPWGHRVMQCEWDMEISEGFEDHEVYNKISHHRSVPPDHEMGPDISHGAKWVLKWKGYTLGMAGDGGTAQVKEQFDPPGGVKAIYPEHYAGYNSVRGNVTDTKLVGGRKHTIRTRFDWVRQDTNFAECNWYRVRWWLDGELQGDFPEFPMWGGPVLKYWEIAPTWGGNTADGKKTREDYMLISRVATWVG